MSPQEACIHWASLLRSVTTGELMPEEALAQRPVVEDSAVLPKTFWNAVSWLESDVETRPEGWRPSEDPVLVETLSKMVGRLEEFGRRP